MVCSVRSAKMAVMARLSISGNYLQSATEKTGVAGHQKLVAQYIQKELLEADDANLLDEKDMHVFDLNPVTDPLHLVFCNLCKKPVKASQFAIHAELCRSLGIAEELFPELDSGTSNRKPQRKERKKSTAGKRLKSTGGQNLSTVDTCGSGVSCSQLDEQIGFTSSCLVEAKGSPGAISGLAGEMIPLAKRCKLIAADTVQLSNAIPSTKDIHHVPAPLATKTYYSQRNNRLQASISHMYHHASMKECCKSENKWQGNLVISEASAPEIFVERI